MFKHFPSRALTSIIVTAALAFSVILFAIPADASASWNIVSSPNASSGQDQLQNISCVSASDCWAVGFSGGISQPGDYLVNCSSNCQTLIEQWNGTSWSVVASPNGSSTGNNQLEGVTCVSASDCWAVGYYCSSCSSTILTLIEQWNGTAWSIVTSPSPNTSNELYAVACSSASLCWASGYAGLMEQWNGTAWSVNSTGLLGSSSQFDSMTCVTGTDCWAAGFMSGGCCFYETAIAQWNGASWSVVTSPNVSSATDYLYGVTCVSASDCWAVGLSFLSASPDQTLVEQYNGTSWSIVTSPNTSTTQNNYLFGVSCTSTTFCMAAGEYINASSYQTLVEEWNGTSWSIATSPNTSTTQNNYLFGTTCVSASDCWAVGGYGSAYQTLVEEYSGTLATLQATVPVNPGTLSFVTAPANFSFTSITLSGFNQTATASQALDIGDNTGSGSGWNVTLSNTTFTSGSNTLANAAFTAASPAVPTCDAGVTCTPASWSGTVTYPFALPGATATKLLSTAVNSGMANQTVTIAWSAAIPAAAMAGTYTSTWTLTLVSGP